MDTTSTKQLVSRVLPEKDIGAAYFRLKATFEEVTAYNSGDDIAANDDLSVIALSSFVLDGSSNSVQNGSFLPFVTIQKLIGEGYVKTNVPMVDVVASPYLDDALAQLAVSGDGFTLAVAQVYSVHGVVNAVSDSTVKIYRESGGSWSVTHTPYMGDAGGGGIKPGIVVSLNENGDYLLIGQRYFSSKKGKVMLYSFNGSTYVLDETLNIVGAEEGDEVGSSVMISRDGTCFIYGSVGENGGTGSAHVYCKDDNGSFAHVTTFHGTDVKSEFGFSIAITSNSSGEKVAAIGARLHDSVGKIDAGLVQVHKKLSSVSSWSPLGSNLVGLRGESIVNYYAGDEFGFSISVGKIQADNSLRIAIGSPNFDADGGDKTEYYHGQVRLYEFNDVSSSDSNDWTEVANGIDGQTKDSAGTSVLIESRWKESCCFFT